MMAWIRSPMARSAAGISAIFASTALSSFAFPPRAAFSSWARSRIAARSSSVNPLDALALAEALLSGFWGVPFFAGFLLAMCPLISVEVWCLPLLSRRAILRHRGPDERLERAGVDLLALMDVDRPSPGAFEARIE